MILLGKSQLFTFKNTIFLITNSFFEADLMPKQFALTLVLMKIQF